MQLAASSMVSRKWVQCVHSSTPSIKYPAWWPISLAASARRAVLLFQESTSSQSRTSFLLLLSKRGKLIPLVFSSCFVCFDRKWCVFDITNLLVRFISINIEGFNWFEATSSGGKGAQRGAIFWTEVGGVNRVGEWSGCAAASVLKHELAHSHLQPVYSV